jgi:hypothetical protein
LYDNDEFECVEHYFALSANTSMKILIIISKSFMFFLLEYHYTVEEISELLELGKQHKEAKEELETELEIKVGTFGIYAVLSTEGGSFMGEMTDDEFEKELREELLKAPPTVDALPLFLRRGRKQQKFCNNHVTYPPLCVIYHGCCVTCMIYWV